MAIKRFSIVVNTTGGAGVSAGNTRVGVPNGRLIAVEVDYHASAPGTTDLTLTSEAGGVTRTLLTLTDRNTDLPLQEIMVPAMDEVGTVLGNNDHPNHSHPIVQGNLVATIAQSDDLTPAATVVVYVDV